MRYINHVWLFFFYRDDINEYSNELLIEGEVLKLLKPFNEVVSMYPVPLVKRYSLLTSKLWSLGSVRVNHVLKVYNNIGGQSLNSKDEEIGDLLRHTLEEFMVFNEKIKVHG